MTALVIVAVSFEIYHERNFGHFVGYGVHTDIVVESDFHFARVLNLSLSTLDIKGCRMGGGYAGNGIFYDFDVQKWDPSNGQWLIFRGADTWDANSHEHTFPLKCAPGEVTHIPPITSRVVAWTYKGWITTPDPIRIVVYTSLIQPAGKQRIIYSETFSNIATTGH
jgi:hypothetical protein